MILSNSKITIQQPPCILVVDDEPIIRQLANVVITSMGFEVLEAVDGLDAVKIFTAKYHSVTAVLLDMSMPRMSGEETFIALRKISQNVPIVLSSGYDKHTATAWMTDQSLTDFLQKPYNPKKLQQIISNIIVSSQINT